MKKILTCALVLVWAFSSAQAQSIRKKTTTKRTTTTTRATYRSTRPAVAAPTVHVSSGNYAARSAGLPAAPDRLNISDPTIVALNARANGGGDPVSNSGIVGMPKRAYGFANGRLMLNSSGSTSSGTITGNGAVGTGSSLGSIGSNGPAIGLNGKSPYAGSTMWGNGRGMTFRYGDSAIRTPRGSKN